MSIQELQTIKGIGPKYARQLADAGILTLEDLATATPEQLQAIVQARGALARYDDWIRQAQERLQEKAREASAPTQEETGLESEPPAPVQLEETEPQPAPAQPGEETAAELQAELQDLVAELNQLAEELRHLAPQFQPPPYTPRRMKALLTENLDRLAPETIKSLQESLEGTTLEDFKDFETWKGVWFTINYLVKLEAAERSQSLRERLTHLPGVSTLADLKEMLQDTPPEEFLNPETWKGVWFLINYELKHTAGELKRRVLGEEATDTSSDWDEDWD